MSRHVALVVFASAAVLTASGCGGGSDSMPDYGSEEGLKIAQLVSRLDDARGDPGKYKTMFAGTAPSNWREYDRYLYYVVVGSPKVDGAGATASVTIHKE